MKEELEQTFGANFRRYLALGVVGALLIIGLILSGSIVEHINADEIMVIQSPYQGTLTWYTTAGIKWQLFGRATHYKKRSQFWFSSKADQGSTDNQALKIRFNDGGHATISGSISWAMPLDEKNLTAIHTQYGSHEAVEQQLVRTTLEKSVYMTGPLMSSKESYAERRNQLLMFIEDQTQNGIYKTETKEVKQPDPMTGQEKMVNIVSLVKDGALIARLDESPLTKFGVTTFNPSINEIAYDPEVEAQIKQQQQMTMQVQTAMAEARQSEQKAITAAKNGEAEAAKAKWAQEVIKAQAVTEAQQQLEVATLNAKAAAQTKNESILLGEGEAERKRLVMNADGALEKKLATYEKVQGMWAEAFAKHSGPMVPNVVTGGGGGGTNAAINANTMIEALSIKALKDLSLEMGVPQGASPRK